MKMVRGIIRDSPAADVLLLRSQRFTKGIEYKTIQSCLKVKGLFNFGNSHLWGLTFLISLRMFENN